MNPLLFTFFCVRIFSVSEFRWKTMFLPLSCTLRLCVKFFALRISFHAIASWKTISLISPMGSIFFSFLAQMELKLFCLRDISKHFRILWLTDLIKNITLGVRALWGRTKTRPLNSWPLGCKGKLPTKSEMLKQLYSSHVSLSKVQKQPLSKSN